MGLPTDGVNGMTECVRRNHTYTDTFFQLKVEGLNLDASGWTDDERRDVLEFHWWKPEELLHTSDLVGPHGLAEFLGQNPF